jgi:probable F420-dependent oxidoreductase
MEIGVRIPHTGEHATPRFVREWCTVAEQAGFASLWGVDHVVMPQHVESEYDLPRTPARLTDDAVSDLLSPNFELMTTLAFVAAVTERITIASGVAVLTIRNAVLTARQLATIDRYSGGRLLVGVGVGWMKEEADAMNMPWDRRGARAEEYLALLRALWTEAGPHVEFHGEFWDLPPMDPEPRPVQQPIPILVGGHSPGAIDRAVRLGDGWLAARTSPRFLSELLPRVHAAAERHGRDPSSVSVYCQGGQGGAQLDDLRRYHDLGVRSLQVHLDTLDELKRFGDEVLPRLATGPG